MSHITLLGKHQQGLVSGIYQQGLYELVYSLNLFPHLNSLFQCKENLLVLMNESEADRQELASHIILLQYLQSSHLSMLLF